MPSEGLLELGSGLVNLTFFVSYHVSDYAAVVALSQIKKKVRDNSGQIEPRPSCRWPAKGGAPFYLPMFKSTDDELY